MPEKNTATELVNQLGAQWSANFDAYASGVIAAHELQCVLCRPSPCSCPPPQSGTTE